MAVQTQILHRRGTAATWTSTNPTLGAGEVGFETDTGKFKLGDGTTAWASLPYAAIDAALLNAKGDLVTATANDTPARLAVGNNGETLVADSSASVGLRYQEPKAGNPIVNSAFQVWQRGTSLAISNATTTYLADRWAAYRGATGSTVSRQTTSDTTNLPNIQYCARVQRDSGNTSTSAISYYNIFESVNSIPFAGKTVTFSFYARAGANYSQASSGLTVVLKTGTGTDQNVYSGFTGVSNAILQTATLTTTWQRFSYTATLATTATQIATGFEFTPVGTAGAADYFEVTGVQLEVGSVATPFKTQGVTLAGELAACQRYYWRRGGQNLYTPVAPIGFTTSTTNVKAIVQHPVAMRTTPTLVEYSTLQWVDSDTAEKDVSAVGINTGASGSDIVTLDFTIATATSYRSGYLRTKNSTSGYLGVSAEL